MKITPYISTDTIEIRPYSKILVPFHIINDTMTCTQPYYDEVH